MGLELWCIVELWPGLKSLCFKDAFTFSGIELNSALDSWDKKITPKARTAMNANVVAISEDLI
jgi:hypothetical protein